MRIAICSDLHLEFGDIVLKNEKKADLLILGGDIMIANDLHDHPVRDPNATMPINLGSRQRAAYQYRDFLARVSFEFPHVIYIAGNHEFYHGKFPGSLADLRRESARFPNIYFLENDVKVIDDLTFIGCTLWTDMNRGDPLTLHSGPSMMTDFNVIRNDAAGYTKLRPAHVMSAFRKSVDYIKTVVAEKHDQKFVVVGHHAPSPLSVHEIYKNEYIMNGMFHSNLSEFILDRPQIKLWTHGHTHHNFDYMLGETRIVCNPRGYIGHELSAETFKLQYVDV